MRVIFVPIADRPECAVALSAAFGLASDLGANVVGCHIRPHEDSDVALPEDLLGDAEWAGSESAKEAVGEGARGLFERAAAERGFRMARRPRPSSGASAVWQEKVGSPDKVMAISGPVSDLLVVSRPATRGGKVARLFMLAAIFNSFRPVLILPQKAAASVGKRVAIAWNQSGEASRAVAAAMPILAAAEQVTIVTCGPETRTGPKASHLARYLGHWGIKPERITKSAGNEEKDVLAAYQESGSDMLVMGAYSRHRLRERVFGGMTDHMLRRASIPVFTLHT